MKSWRSTLILTVLVLTGYTSFWFYQANQLEKALISCLNDVVKSSNRTCGLQYDRIEKSGYPFTIKLAIVNPKVTQTVTTEPEVCYQLTGNLTTHFTLLGRLKKCQHRGKSIVSFPGTSCIADGSIVVDVENEHIDSAKITCKPLSITLEDTTKAVACPFWIVDVEAYAKLKKSAPDRRHLKLDATIVGSDIGDMEHISSPTSCFDYISLAGTLLSQKSGTRTYEIKGVFDVPAFSVVQQIANSPLQLVTHRVPKVSINFQHIDHQDSLLQTHGSGNLLIDEDDDKRVRIDFRAHSTGLYSEHFQKALQEVIDQIQKVVPDVQLPVDLKSLVPKAHELGQIVSHNDLSIRINKNDHSWKVELGDNSMRCEQYGVAINGELKGDPRPVFGRCELELQQADRLCHDMMAYYNRSLSVINELRGDKPPLAPLSDTARQKIIRYLSELSQPAKQTPDNKVIEARFASGKFEIGTLSFDEFRSKTKTLWNELTQELIPHSEEPEPSG